MTDEISRLSGAVLPQGVAWRPDGWILAAILIAALVAGPIVTVAWLALHPVENIWPHLISTALPRYLSNTLLLAGATGVLAAMVGTGAAWLVVLYRFPGVRWLEWALLLPMAIPAYIGAYALVDFLEYAGPVQTGLRATFGWADARSYWFPDIRSRGAAIVVLTAALYPYVYLLARAAFREQSGAVLEVAQALGAGPVARFLRVGLPLARPAIAAGMALVMMETVNDFGVVDYFGVQTLTTGIFSVWLVSGNAGGAAQIACVILGLVLMLVLVEKVSRNRGRHYRPARSDRPVVRHQLRGIRAWVAFCTCLLPFALGFVLPVMVIGGHALQNADRWLDPGLMRAFVHTLVTGGAAAVVTVGAALSLVYAVRLGRHPLLRRVLPVTAIGYAAPGAVLGLGILMPLAAVDNRIADGILALTGWDPGLMLTGSAVAIVYAYAVRFFALAQGASEAALGRVPPSLSLAARTLGQTAGGVLWRVHLPLIRASVGTALLLVFVDCVKELPATLLLRPFNYNTLATRVYEQASLERIGDAAPAALLVMAVSLLAVAVLARAQERG